MVDDIDEDDDAFSPEMEEFLENINQSLKPYMDRKKQFKEDVNDYVEEKIGDGSVQLDEIDSAIINVKVAVAEGEVFPAWEDVKFLVESGDSRAIEMFIESINDGWPGADRFQLEAIEALGNTGGVLEEEAIKALGKSLGWGNHSVAERNFAEKSALALGKFNNPSAAGVLVNAFVHPEVKDEGNTRRAITRSLGEMAERRGDDEALAESLANAVEPLIESLGDSEFSYTNRQSWEGPIYALGHIGDERAVGPLISLMEESEDWRLKGHIAESLGRIGDIQSLDPILKLYGSGEDGVRRGELGFITGLGLLGDSRATPLLTEWLHFLIEQRNHRRDSDGWYFQFVIRALGRIGDEESIDDILHVYAVDYRWQIGREREIERGEARNRALEMIRNEVKVALVRIGEDGRDRLSEYSDGFYADKFSEIEDPEITHKEYEEDRNRQNNLIRELIRDVLDSIEPPT